MAPLGGVTLRRLFLFLAAALIAASCGSATDTVAATVNGTDILVSDVLELRDTYGEEAVPGAEFRDDLSRVIFQEVVAQGLEAEFGLVVAPALVDARVEEFNTAIEANGITRADALGIDGATEELLRREALAFELRSAGVELVAAQEDAVVDLVANDPQSVTEVCVRHILVETRAEAEDVAERLGAGEDFSAVATEVSLDAGTPGGDLGCSLAGRYVSEFAEASMVAPVGALFGPIQTDFGFHVLIVDERNAPTSQDVRDDPLAFVSEDLAGALWLDWFNLEVDTADINVASQIGSWNSDASGISPPPGG